MTDKDIAAMREDAEEARKVLSGSYTIPREGVEALAMDYATQCAEQMPLVLDEVERLREIVRAVAAIKVTGGVDRNLPYDAQISAWTVHKSRALLSEENK